MLRHRTVLPRCARQHHVPRGLLRRDGKLILWGSAEGSPAGALTAEIWLAPGEYSLATRLCNPQSTASFTVGNTEGARRVALGRGARRTSRAAAADRELLESTLSRGRALLSEHEIDAAAAALPLPEPVRGVTLLGGLR